MSVFMATAKRAGARTLNATQNTRIAISSLSSTATNLPCTEAGAKLTTVPILSRNLSNNTQLNTYVDEHDPESRFAINTERNEYSKSGTDNAVAAQDSAWDLKNHTPEQAKEESEVESAQNGRNKASPLEVSPANQEVSKFTDETGRGAFIMHGPSKRISPKKGKRVDYGGGEIIEEDNNNEATKM
ncbi:hypothetical protein LOZ58_003787 [Ophidiomyces ophidiicola]|nr:hypothetical protein LOZ58_003787 [Ophidiomyces ophidiicola]